MKIIYWMKVVVLSLSVLMLTSCSSGEENVWLKSPDWSRGVFVGATSVHGPVSFVKDSDGTTTFFLVEFDEETSNYSFDLAQMFSGSADLNHSRIALGELQNVKQPEIVLDDNGNLRLFWISSEGLYTLAVSGDGGPLGEPVLLSGAEVVASYDIAHAPDGGFTLWFAGSRRNPGIFALSDHTGSVQSDLVDADGTLVRLRYDDRGQLHAVWVHYPFGYEITQIQYGIYDPALSEFAIPYSPVISLNLGIQKRLDDLALGVDDSNVYLFWVTSVQAGLQAGDVQASYRSFPIGDNGQDAPSLLMRVPTVYSLEFEGSSGNLKAGDRVSLLELNVPTTPKVQDFRTNLSAAGEVVLAVRSPAEHLWRKTREQVNLVYFDNGSLTDYQPLTFTSSLSTLPNVVNDPNGYVSVTWLERLSSDLFYVYFASTDPTVIDEFDAMSTGEYLNVVYTTLFGMLIGALLAPIAAGVWLFAPLIVLALFSFAHRLFPPRIGRYLSIAALVIAVGVVWFVKLAVFPNMWVYVPFSAWIPNIPVLLGDVLRMAVPLLTLVVSSFTAWHFTYRRGNDSSLYFMLIYVAVDALITTSVYAVLIYGTYVQ
ncbi:MAG TPA: hypothetical protein VK851_07495 [Anaerolineales bacterium]|nr:hypothetical protein [Anaerolineales bacterium]